MAMQCKNIHKVNIFFAEPRPGIHPAQPMALHYRETTYKEIF